MALHVPRGEGGMHCVVFVARVLTPSFAFERTTRDGIRHASVQTRAEDGPVSADSSVWTELLTD